MSSYKNMNETMNAHGISFSQWEKETCGTVQNGGFGAGKPAPKPAKEIYTQAYRQSRTYGSSLKPPLTWRELEISRLASRSFINRNRPVINWTNALRHLKFQDITFAAKGIV